MDVKDIKQQEDINLIKDESSFYITLVICLIVFFGAIFLLITSFNNLISKHDQKLSGEICTLVSEKMNNSIESMTESASSIALVLSAQQFSTPDEIYTLLNDYRKKNYLSLGFIDASGVMYATDEEKAEFEKWQLMKMAQEANPVSMTMPYRSSTYGQLVVTIFSVFEYSGSQKGYIFLTYRLSDLQKMATTESLDNDIGIWLMNAESANLIQCAGADAHAIGSWTNAYLSIQNVNRNDRDIYRGWLDRVRLGEDNVGISYSMESTIYSQFCSKIKSMPGWYVTVRIPSNALSATMNTFRNYVLYFLAVLLLVVIVLIANMYRLSKRENTMLTQLSIHDPLTGVLNRRAFDFAAEKKLARGKEAALIFFDIDFFKQVNDRFGHDAGDKLLVAFSDSLKNNFSNKGIISRFGGDEFVVLTDMDSVVTITNQLVKTINNVHAIHLDKDNNKENTDGFIISFSAGASQYPADADNLSDLKKCADLALYDTKRKGRNGYTWYTKGMTDKTEPVESDAAQKKPVKKVVKKVVVKKVVKKGNPPA